MDTEKTYLLAGEIISSKYRMEILYILEDSVMKPGEISLRFSKKNAQVSKALTELKKRKLVVCLNEEKTKGRLYTATDEGKEVLKIIKEIKD